MSELQPASGAAPVLDIGGDVGALVVYLGVVPSSGELEACPAGEPSGRFHTGVHVRPVGDALVPVAVFPAVVAGTYDLLDEQGGPVATVVVEGAAVREIDLR